MEKVGKIVTILLWVLLIVSAVLIVSMMVNISENEMDPTMGSWINSNLVWAYILLAVGAGIAVLASLFHMFTDIKAAKKGLLHRFSRSGYPSLIPAGIRLQYPSLLECRNLLTTGHLHSKWRNW